METEESGKYLCAAPDTFLGSALQTARRAVDEGEIGEITGFTVNANRCQDLMTVILPNNNLPGGGVGLNYGIYYMTALFCLYGTKGVLRLTDANQFGGQVTLIKNTSDYFHPEEIPLDYGLPYEKDSRGVGPAEMAAAILSGRESRTDKAMAIHVLDVFCVFNYCKWISV